MRFIAVQLLFLFLLVVGAALMALVSGWVPWFLGGSLAMALLLWVLTSVLWPSRPDRRCPQCGAEGLVKIRRGKPGVCCEVCSFRDESLHVAYLDDW